MAFSASHVDSAYTCLGTLFKCSAVCPLSLANRIVFLPRQDCCHRGKSQMPFVPLMRAIEFNHVERSP
jgi:hypothetical protein